MDIRDRVAQMDAIVAKGAIVDGVKQFFAENATTADYGDGKTTGKAEMIAKLEGFAASIAKVNRIEHHQTLVDGSTTASEFTFDFDMADGSKIFWHEIILRVWNDGGEVVQESYFNAA